MASKGPKGKTMLNPTEFLEKVEFRDAALMSFVVSAVIVPTYDAVKHDLGITRSEYLFLMCLSHYPVLTAQDVSRLSGRPRNSISRAVHRMLAVGHLARNPDPSDARQARLSITETGRALHRQHAGAGLCRVKPRRVELPECRTRVEHHELNSRGRKEHLHGLVREQVCGDQRGFLMQERQPMRMRPAQQACKFGEWEKADVT